MSETLPGFEGAVDLNLKTNLPIYGVVGEGKGSRITLMVRSNGKSVNGPFGQALVGDEYFFRSSGKALAEAGRLNALVHELVRQNPKDLEVLEAYENA